MLPFRRGSVKPYCPMRFPIAALAVLFSAPTVSAWEDICSPFEEIYADGTELCEIMWGGAFEVVPDESHGYTMWFFDTDHNPNDNVTRALLGQDAHPTQCGLKYFHKVRENDLEHSAGED